MEDPLQALVIRAAREEDRGPVLAFCVDTFSWGDYIAEVWDDWLHAADGHLMVAELGGVPVGLQHVSFPSAREAWLQGMRVDPALRRRGIATALFGAGMDLVRARGARHVRLMTKTDNAPVHHMMEEAGFRRLLTYTERQAPADTTIRSRAEPAVEADLAGLLRILEASAGFAAGERTHVWHWRSLELSRETLLHHLQERQVYVVRENGRPAAMSLAEAWQDEPVLWIGTIHGAPDAVRDLTLGLRAQAAALGAEEVVAYVPYADSVVEALTAAGFSAGGYRPVPDMDLFVKDVSTP